MRRTCLLAVYVALAWASYASLVQGLTLSFDQANYTVEEGGNVTLTAIVSSVQTVVVNVSVTVVDGSTETLDYTVEPQMLSFQVGEVAKHIIVTANTDGILEEVEDLMVMVEDVTTEGSGGGLLMLNTSTSTEVLIQDIDQVVASIEVQRDSVAEGEELPVTVNLTGAILDRLVSLDISSQPPGLDETVTFTAGMMSQEVLLMIPFNKDMLDEREVTLSLVSGDRAVDVSSTTDSITITDSTVNISFSPAMYLISEGGSVNGSLLVNNPGDRTVTINVTSGNETEYTVDPTSVEINPAQSSYSLKLTGVPDMISQDFSSRFVEDLVATSAEEDVGVVSAMAEVEIIDTTIVITLDESAYIVDEGSYVTVNVSANSSIPMEVEVTLTTAPGTATPVLDYAPVSEVLVFNSSQTYNLVNITAYTDDLVEGDENFFLNLSSTDNVEFPVNNVPVTIADLTVLVLEDPQNTTGVLDESVTLTCEFETVFIYAMIVWERVEPEGSGGGPVVLEDGGNIVIDYMLDLVNDTLESSLNIASVTFDNCGEYRCVWTPDFSTHPNFSSPDFSFSPAVVGVPSKLATLSVVELTSTSSQVMNASVGSVGILSCTIRYCGSSFDISWFIPEDVGNTPIQFNSSESMNDSMSQNTSMAIIDTLGVINENDTQNCFVAPVPGLEIVFTFNLENVRITNISGEAIVLEGSTTNITCVAQNPPGVEDRSLIFAWFNCDIPNLEACELFNDARFSIDNSFENMSVLTITNIQREYDGVYVCKVTNRVPFTDAVMDNFTIDVIGRPVLDFPIPDITDGIIAGVNTTITCDAFRSNPPVTNISISRRENGERVVLAMRGSDEQMVSYTITNPSVDDTGTEYICTAISDAGNYSESFELIVQDRPAMVNISTLRFKLLSLLVVNLTWTAPDNNNSPISSYTVFVSLCVNREPSEPCSATTVNNYTTTSNFSYLLLGVQAERRYEVTISATNGVGESDISDAGTVMGPVKDDAKTELTVDFVYDKVIVLRWVLPLLAITDVARDPPENFGLSPVAIKEYALFFNGSVIGDIPVNEDDQSFLLSGLEPNTPYAFVLNITYVESSLNGITNMPSGEATTLRVLVPEPPPNQEPEVGPNGIAIAWSPVESDDVINYEVILRLDGSSSAGRRKRQNRSPLRRLVSPGDTRFTFPASELIPNQQYLVSVEAILNAGGVEARVLALAPISVTAAEQLPTSPNQVSIVAEGTSFTSFQVEWRPPSSANGIITEYIVSYTPTRGGSSQMQLVDVSPGSNQQVFTATISGGVTHNTRYSVRVAAVNGAGTGPQSSPLAFVETRPGVFPATILSIIPVEENGTYSLSIRFSTQYGPISHYLLFVLESDSAPSDTSNLRNSDAQRAAPIDSSNLPAIAVGDNSITRYLNSNYTNSPVERNTQYFFVVRVFSSEDLTVFNDSIPRGPSRLLSKETQPGPNVVAIIAGVLGAVAVVLCLVLIVLVVCALCGGRIRQRVYKLPPVRKMMDGGEKGGGIELRRRTRLFTPVLDVGDPNIFTTAGQPTTLLCEVSGTPAPTVTWTREGKLLEDERFLILADHSLFIQDTRIEDEGSYLVRAENSAGVSEFEIKVTVIKPVPPEPDKDHPPIPVDNFPEYYARISANDEDDLEEEYGEIEPDFSFTNAAAKLTVNRNKNRYINIIPYDHSRVVLSLQENTPGTDYINASYLDGYKATNCYIASQGPNTSTLADFWRMVWEMDCPTIVMVTKLKEEEKEKCTQYWPSYGSTTYGNIQVTLKEAENLAEYSIRTFSVSPLAGQSIAQMPVREVKQFHFLKWPDHGVPQYPTALLHFRKRVYQYHPEKRGPMVVHCSAGVGRTGTFITVDYCMQMMEAEGTVDIFNFVQQMRYKRNYMVQTPSQYSFLHTAIHEVITCGDTSIKAPELKTWLAKLEPDPATGKTILDSQFGRLNEASPHDEDFDCTVAEVNKDKNRAQKHLPANDQRVILSSEGDLCDYICASPVDGYRQRNAFIVTQGPMKNTVADFWRMVWEMKSAAIVMLTELEENGEEMSVKYWPDEVGQPEVFGLFHVELSSDVRELGDYCTRKLKLSPVDKAHESRIVTQFHYTKWTSSEPPSSVRSMIDMIDELQRVQRKSGNQPITVHCSDGLGRTGAFVTLYYVLDRVKAEQVVDVFQAVKTLRIQRPGLLDNMGQYLFVHKATMEFLDTFSDYQNFK